MSIRHRIFIVGVPRSGTTLLQSLLAAHSELTSFTESHFFSRYFSLTPVTGWPVLTKDPSARVHEFLTENSEGPVTAWAGDLGRLLLPLHTRAVTRRLLSVMDELAQRRGKSGWIEKTPKHLRYMPLIESVADAQPHTIQPHVIHLVRDGLETVASLYKASQSWERPYDLEECVRRWNDDVQYSMKRLRKAPENNCCVFYEDLVEAPEKVLQGLCGRLGLAWEPEMLVDYRRASEELIAKGETWKKDTGREIRRSATASEVLTPEERERVRALLKVEFYERLRHFDP